MRSEVMHTRLEGAEMGQRDGEQGPEAEGNSGQSATQGANLSLWSFVFGQTTRARKSATYRLPTDSREQAQEDRSGRSVADED